MHRRDFLAAAAALPALAQTADDGFTPLFDGRTLRGWTIEQGPETAFYVDDNAIVVHPGSGFPAWLRSERQYENFELRGEFFIKGWMDSGIYLHAPEHGRPMWCGMEVHIFHAHEENGVLGPQSMGAIFPLVAPRKFNIRNQGEWNRIRILMDWPRLTVWTNDEVIQDVDVESVPELRHRLRAGYLGLQSLSYPIRFRKLEIRELPSKVSWTPLYERREDFAKWYVSEDQPDFQPLGAVLRGDGHGHLATRETYRDFELQMYVRHALHHNGGVLFRTAGKGLSAKHYEIQLHDVEGAHFPTGSLYYFRRAAYPRIQAGEWFLFQMAVKDRNCLVRINGDTVMEYDRLENLDEGHIELQAHERGKWEEFKQILVRRT